MELATQPDFPRTMQRFEAWWQCEVIDRPPVRMTAANNAPVAWPKKKHNSQRERWFDLEYRLEEFAAFVQSRKWLADSFPHFMPNLGPEILATLYGAELEFTPDSSWSKPICHSSREVMKLKANLECPYWQWIRQATDLSIERGKGHWLTSVTDLHTHADLLAALREPQELLLELMDDYQGVKQAINYLAPLFDDVYDDQAKRIQRAGQPVTSWIATPHMGRGCVLQADFICMVSPEMFQDVFLPALQYEVNKLECSIFHLDGPNALQHLDALLECRGLSAIQWVHGAGNGTASRWIDVYQRIQAGGKAMEIVCDGIEDALQVAEHLKPQGCFFNVMGNYSEAQINEFLAQMSKWTATGRL